MLFLYNFSLLAQTLLEQAESGDMVAQYLYADSLTNWRPKEDDYKKAIIWLKKSAEQGYNPAQCSLGDYYRFGRGIKKDYVQAVYWYKRSAEQGNKTAEFNLGECFANGQGVSQSDERAFFWYGRSADKGYKNAECALGKAYFYGKGTMQNYKQAVELFSKAANQENHEAKYYLGECYSHGFGVTKNMEKAIEWYKKGANDLETNSQYALALLYLKGDGVEKDSVRAADYLLHSAGGGWCSPQQKFSYNKKKANNTAKEKLLDLCSLNNSPKQYHFLAMAGCLYEAMQDYFNAERCYKHSIDLGGDLGAIELGLMYFYVAANTTQFFPNHDNSEEGDVERIGLESYKIKDNTACLEYVKTKKWTDVDNVAYWLEKAISSGSGSFSYGAMPYNIYEHLLFVYVDGVGGKKNIDRAIDIAVQCLEDSTIRDGINALTTLEIAIKKPNLESKVFQSYLKINENHRNRLNDDNKRIYIATIPVLGKCYYKGVGTQKNYDIAFKYLFEAANNGDCESMRLLAACYRFGRGISTNKEKENEWVNKAANCGDKKAMRIKKQRN